MQDESVHSEDKLFRQEKSFNRARRKRGRQQANMVAMGAPFSKVMVSALGYRGRVDGVYVFHYVIDMLEFPNMKKHLCIL